MPDAAKTRLIVPPRGALLRTGPEDPLHYYYRPLLGRFYRARLRQALSLLSPPYGTILELGYGSGLLIPSLAGIGREVIGIDREADPREVGRALKKLGVAARLLRGDARDTGLKAESVDLVAAISILEHIPDPRPVLEEAARVLKPGGELLVGMPRVGKAMTRLFRCVGWDQADNCHVTAHRTVLKAAAGIFRLRASGRLPRLLPERLGLYYNLLFLKP